MRQTNCIHTVHAICTLCAWIQPACQQVLSACLAGVVPSATMQSKDGKYVIIGGNGDSIYTRLMAAVGRPDMGGQNPTYATNSLRCDAADEIYQVRKI